MGFELLRQRAAIAIWLVCALVGPLPWVLLAAIWLHAQFASVGFAFGFIGAPLLWAALTLMGFWAKPRWATVVAAALGALVLVLIN